MKEIPVQCNTWYYSKVYGYDEDQANSHPSQYSGIKEGPGDEHEAGSSNNNSQPTNKIACDRAKQLRIHAAQGKAIISKGDESVKIDVEENKRWCHDLNLVETLFMDGGDFSMLLKIDCLEFYSDALDRGVYLRTMLKYYEIENLKARPMEVGLLQEIQSSLFSSGITLAQR